jgi:hypothetical protein
MFWRKTAAVIVVLIAFGALPVLAEGVKGKIASVRTAKSEFTLTESFKNWKFELDKGGKVFLNDKDSRLADLKPGDEASVTFDKLGDKLIAREVRCKRK